ncbi:MAG TPA: TolC family protein [Thermoanaerobaculia bacterium]|nr:TolC family protein [Thermoanaerobaculia bacterium]
MRNRSSKRVAGILLASSIASLPGLAQEPARGPRTLVLSLEDALRIAAGESESIWVAESGVMRAVGGERIVRSQLFPQVSASAQYTRTLRSQFDDISFGGAPDEGGEEVDLPFGRENQYTLGLNLSQLLFDGGQVFAQRRAAEARRRSAEIEVDSALAQTLLDVTQAYFDSRLSDQLVTIAETSLQQTEEILRQTEVARQVGDKSEFELLRARVARDNQRPVLIRRRTARSEAYLQLKQLLNIPPEDEVTLTTGVEEEVARFTRANTAAEVSPDERAPVRQAAENVEANEAQLAETRGQRLPSLTLSSRYAPVAFPEDGIPEPGDFQEDWTVTVSLSVPILTWGRLRGNEQVARGNLDEARARLVQTREAAALDARLAANDLADASATLEASLSTTDEARRAYSIAQVRFREGIASQIELADSRLLLEQAEVNRAQALRDLQVARARLALLEDLPLGTFGTGGVVVPSFQTPQVPTQQTNPQNPTVTASSVPNTGGTGAPIP